MISKRRLTIQQQKRIREQQQQKRDAATVTNEAETTPEGKKQKGLVIAHFGRHVDVETEDTQIKRCHLRQNLGTIAVGDNVTYCIEPQDTGVIVALEPRRSALYRYNKFTGDKLIAANIDQLYIVIAAKPARSINVLDRYIMLAECQNIQPVIIFNKSDLLSKTSLTEIDILLSYYQALGYPYILTSTKDATGFKPLYASLKDKTSVFVGLSGVGKSSIINAILPEEDLAVGQLSEKSDEGMHTTTTAKLFHLPEGGNLIDCPGIRELAIGNMTRADILYGFKDLKQLSVHCQFRDCSHTHEPGCAILNAEKEKDINLERLSSYRSIVKELSTN